MRLQCHFTTRSGQAQNGLDFEGSKERADFGSVRTTNKLLGGGNVAASLLAFTRHSMISSRQAKTISVTVIGFVQRENFRCV